MLACCLLLLVAQTAAIGTRIDSAWCVHHDCPVPATAMLEALVHCAQGPLDGPSPQLLPLLPGVLANCMLAYSKETRMYNRNVADALITAAGHVRRLKPSQLLDDAALHHALTKGIPPQHRLRDFRFSEDDQRINIAYTFRAYARPALAVDERWLQHVAKWCCTRLCCDPRWYHARCGYCITRRAREQPNMRQPAQLALDALEACLEAPQNLATDIPACSRFAAQYEPGMPPRDAAAEWMRKNYAGAAAQHLNATDGH
jgi:hypothetical protein